jgi:hypothetical protein
MRSKIPAVKYFRRLCVNLTRNFGNFYQAVGLPLHVHHDGIMYVHHCAAESSGKRIMAAIVAEKISPHPAVVPASCRTATELSTVAVEQLCQWFDCNTRGCVSVLVHQCCREPLGMAVVLHCTTEIGGRAAAFIVPTSPRLTLQKRNVETRIGVLTRAADMISCPR